MVVKKKKKAKIGILAQIKSVFGSNVELAEKDILISKLQLEVKALNESVRVYEKAVLNEREVATNALKALETLRIKNGGSK
jgi:hypothetical protein